jgi:hypothetical protein
MANGRSPEISLTAFRTQPPDLHHHVLDGYGLRGYWPTRSFALRGKHCSSDPERNAREHQDEGKDEQIFHAFPQVSQLTH